MEEGKYYYAYQLVEYYDKNLATAKERALLYEKVGETQKAVEEYSKVGDYESLYRAGMLLKDAQPKESLEFLERAFKLAKEIPKEGTGRTHFGDKAKAWSCRGKKRGLFGKAPQRSKKDEGAP